MLFKQNSTKLKWMSLAGLLVGFLSWASLVQAAKVVVTIPPLASMVKPLLSEQDELVVLLKPGASPHGFQLKPSHLVALNQADVVVALGSPIDQWAHKAIRQTDLFRNQPDSVIFAQKQPGLVLLEAKEADIDPVKKTEGSHHEEHDHHDHHGHNHGEHHDDLHIWLSPENAQIVMKAFANWQQTHFPEQKDGLTKRQQKALAAVQMADADVAAQLQSVQTVPYVVLHDAFQYFEQRYQLKNLGSVQVSAELKPSVKRVMELRKLLSNHQVKCVFREPQFSDKQLKYVIDGLPIFVGTIDPIGRDEEVKPYPEFLRQLGQQYVNCLEKGL